MILNSENNIFYFFCNQFLLIFFVFLLVKEAIRIQSSAFDEKVFIFSIQNTLNKNNLNK